MASSINASTSGAGGVITTADNTGILNLQTASTTAVTVDASQNVGIGRTPSGSYVFEVNNTSFLSSNQGSSTGTVGVPLALDSKTTGAYATGQGSALQFQITYSGGAAAGCKIASINNADNNTADLVFYPRNYGYAEAMRINSIGQVSISNVSAYSTPEGVFTVNGTGCGDYIGAINNRNTSNCGPAHGLIFRAGYNGSSSASNFFSFRRPDNTVLGSITQNGASNVSYATSSDYRLKENITPMTGALEKIAQLNPVNWTWKTDGSDGQGFIAHELAEVVPYAVTGEKDAVDVEGNPQYQGVDTSFLVATLTAAIKEQQVIINDLKARIETLEAK